MKICLIINFNLNCVSFFFLGYGPATQVRWLQDKLDSVQGIMKSNKRQSSER